MYVFKRYFRIYYMQSNKNVLTAARQRVIDKFFAEILEAPHVYDIETVSKELPKVAEIIAEEIHLMYGVAISEHDITDYLKTIPKD